MTAAGAVRTAFPAVSIGPGIWAPAPARPQPAQARSRSSALVGQDEAGLGEHPGAGVADRRVVRGPTAFEQLASAHDRARFWFLTTKSPRPYWDAIFADGDFLVFGRETKGLPETLLAATMTRG